MKFLEKTYPTNAPRVFHVETTQFVSTWNKRDVFVG